MWHTAFIAVHAGAGGIALVTGCVALAGGGLFRTYLWSLVTMELLLVLAIGAKWAVIHGPTRVLFGALAMLGAYLVWHADQARRIRASGLAEPSARYVAHIGFTLIALADAFVVILVLHLGAPVWMVATSGVLTALAGHVALRAVQAQQSRHRDVASAGAGREPAAPARTSPPAGPGTTNLPAPSGR